MMSLLLTSLSIAGCTCEAPRIDLPTYRAQRLSTPPTLDGVLDETFWSTAASTDAFVNTLTGQPASPHTRAKIAYDAEFLYVAFEVEDNFLRATLSGHDAHLWEQDTVELMIDPDGDGLNYFELQFSPTGETFDTRYDSRRIPGPFGHVDWDSRMTGGVQVRGTVNDEGMDEGYTVELAIPFSSLASDAHSGQTPTAGSDFRVALYVLDARPQGQGGVGWSPPMVGDFHVPDRFGRVIFESAD